MTIPGRGPVCFKCKHTGHTRGNCTTPYCRHCSTYGHTSEDCATSVLTHMGQQQQQRQEVDMDEPEECDVNPRNIQDKQGKTENTTVDVGEKDTPKVIPETDQSTAQTTQSTSADKVNDDSSVGAQEIFGDISDIKDSEVGSDGGEGSDTSTSNVCDQDAEFQTAKKKLTKDKTRTIKLLRRGKLKNKATKTKIKLK